GARAPTQWPGHWCVYPGPSTNAVGRSVLDANPKGDSRNNVYHFLTLVLESTKVGATVSLTVAWRNGGRRHTRTHGRVLGPNQDCCYVERSEEHTSELQSRFDLVCRL